MKKLYLTITLNLLCLSFIFTNTWTLSDSENKKIFTDETGKTCEITSNENLNAEALSVIETSLNTVWSLPGLEGTKSQVYVEENNYFHFIFFPDSLVHNGVELKKAMPAGLSFRYDTALFYDVTLKVDEYLPRVTGAYISPTDFLDQLFAAYTMPEYFLDGEMLLKRLERLEETLMALSKKSMFSKPSLVSDEVTLAVVSLHNQNPNITIDEAYKNIEKQGIKVTKKDVEAVFMVYLGIFE